MGETPMDMERYAGEPREELVDTMGALLESAREIDDRTQRMVAIFKELIARRDTLDANGTQDEKTKELIATYRRRSDAIGRELRQLSAQQESLLGDLRGLSAYLAATSEGTPEA